MQCGASYFFGFKVGVVSLLIAFFLWLDRDRPKYATCVWVLFGVFVAGYLALGIWHGILYSRYIGWLDW